MLKLRQMYKLSVREHLIHEHLRCIGTLLPLFKYEINKLNSPYGRPHGSGLVSVLGTVSCLRAFLKDFVHKKEIWDKMICPLLEVDVFGKCLLTRVTLHIVREIFTNIDNAVFCTISPMEDTR